MGLGGSGHVGFAGARVLRVRRGRGNERQLKENGVHLAMGHVEGLPLAHSDHRRWLLLLLLLVLLLLILLLLLLLLLYYYCYYYYYYYYYYSEVLP
jgi:hypothetical protein